ncbi:transposase, partial [Sedimentitalea sp.]|uniref:transposase n=1 Tax=Sedimentitalea sp. TaxID=2048915 RepID=UPI003297DF10
MHGGTEWCTEKHGGKKPRKTWRKLHIGLDPDTGEIVAFELTTEHVGDETALPGLLSKADADVARFLADGAYDGQGVDECLAATYGAN